MNPSHISVGHFTNGVIDIAGPFPEGPGKVKFLIVAMDYFTKWIKAKPVATITGSQTNILLQEPTLSREEGIKARRGKENKNGCHPNEIEMPTSGQQNRHAENDEALKSLRFDRRKSRATAIREQKARANGKILNNKLEIQASARRLSVRSNEAKPSRNTGKLRT
ncbi:reverse transcriptase domain-containing protein [Tanacetum coccineum]